MRIQVGNITFVPLMKAVPNKGEEKGFHFVTVPNMFAIPGRKVAHKDKIRDWANRVGMGYAEFN